MGVPDAITILVGDPWHVALHASDADGDSLTYTATPDDTGVLTAGIPKQESPTGNSSMRVSVVEKNSNGTVSRDFGDMVFELFEGRTPVTTSKIIELVDAGFYTGKKFHRILDGFMMQGGSKNGDGTGSSGFAGFPFADEFVDSLRHTTPGLLSMANSGANTNDSQFFVIDAPTRHLDEAHSIFGMLTTGDGVRREIMAVQTTTVAGTGSEKSLPLKDVVIQSITIEEDDQNAVMLLSASGTPGQTVVTVTVSDGGLTASKEVLVTVVDPSWATIDPVSMQVDTPHSFTPPAPVDLGGNDVGDATYRGVVYPGNDDLLMKIDANTGQTTLTPSNGLVGAHTIWVEANVLERNWSQSQYVPVYITPDAPTKIELLKSADTGTSNTDGVTSRNNTAGSLLRFRVYGVIPGAEVTVYADGTPIGQAIVPSTSGSEVIVETNGTVELADGIRSITARQTLRNQQAGDFDPVDLVSGLSAELEITVDATPPEIQPPGVLVAPEGRAFSYQVQTDENAADLVFSVHEATGTLPPGIKFDSTTPGLLVWPKGSVQQGDFEALVTASDKAGNPAQETFQIHGNAAPELSLPFSSLHRVLSEQEAWSFEATATDDENDLPLTFSLDPEGLPGGVQITQTDDTHATVSWTPDETQGPREYDVTVRVTDAAGATSAKTLHLSVKEHNRAPELDPIADRTGGQSIREGELLAFDAVAGDLDVPANELTFSLAPGAPQGATIDPASGHFTWTPKESQGDKDFTITVRVTDDGASTDQGELSDEQTFHVRVDEVNAAPAFDPLNSPVVVPGEQLRVTVVARDPDDPDHAHPIVYSLVDPPAGASIDNSGELVWNVPEDQPFGPVQLTIKATEDLGGGEFGLSTTETLKVNVFDFRMVALSLAASDRGVAQPAMPSQAFSPGLAPWQFEPAPAPAPSATGTGAPGATDSGATGVFGFQIGPDTGLGSSGQSPVRKKGAEKQETKEPGADEGKLPASPDELKKDESEKPQPESQSDGSLPAAVDAVLEALAADAQSPAEETESPEDHDSDDSSEPADSQAVAAS